MLSRRTDTLVALALAAALQLDLWFVEEPRGDRLVTALAAVALGCALVVRRTRPLLCVAVSAAAMVAQSALGGWLTSMLSTAVASMVLVLSAALHLPRARAAAAALLFLAATWVDLLLVQDEDYSIVSDLVFTAVVVVGMPWLAGRALRERRTRADELEELARQLAEEREQRAVLAVLDERNRIAREMHDVVAHSVSLMVVQAGAARRMAPTDPDRANAALLAVEDAGRQALGELRRVLGVLRGGPEPTDLSPQPGTAQLEALVGRARASGLPVHLTVTGQPLPLQPGLELAVYRVVQEALTNALKHAGGAVARVSLGWSAHTLDVEVVDDGPGCAEGPIGGHGLIGMRERIAAYGGELRSGGLPGGGFEVSARIPLDGQQA